MRVVTLSLVLLASVAVSAQEADPNPAWTYDPVAVGNVRAYAKTQIPFTRSRVDSPAAITLDGERWVIRRTQSFERTPDSYGWTRTESRQLVRFDTAAANVRVWTPDGSEQYLYPCSLDLPVPAEDPGTCDSEVGPVFYTVSPESTVRVGTDTLSRGVRTLEEIGWHYELASGIGVVSETPDGGTPSDLVYAVVSGDTLGAYPDDFPATEIDPTPGWWYYPLSVGDEWEYEQGNPNSGPSTFIRTRRRVVGTSDEDGATYFDIERSTLDADTGTWVVDGFDNLRYDTLSARVVDPEGGSVSRCPFDEPPTEYSDGGLMHCVFSGDLERFAAFLGTRTIETSDGVSVQVASKQFEYVGIADGVATPVYIAGIGFYRMEGYWGHVPAYHYLAYASVRQEDGNVLEIGARFNVDSDGDARRDPLAITASPNPTTGPLALSVNVPVSATVTLEAFDALGRRVWSVDLALGVGRQQVEVDAVGWAPGLYVVRAQTDAASATATVVRR